MQTLDRTLLALADPTRRAILDRIGQGEVRVTEIAKPFEMSLNAISKHILTLERAELIQRRKQGREHFIALKPNALDETAQWIESQKNLWKQRLQKLDDMLQAQDRESDAIEHPTIQNLKPKTQN